MRKAIALTALTLVLLAPAAHYAPTFLIVSDAPAKSDAVILFLGGEKGTREKEARQLIKEGWAEYLIIPARSQVQKLDPNGKLIRLDLRYSVSDQNKRTNELTNQQTAPPNQPTNELTNQRTPSPGSSSLNQGTNELTKLRNRVVEDTHQEALIARDMMVRMGLRSAILVSAPYHMRRIKLIAGKVFGDSPPFTLVPTRYEPPNDDFWFFNSYDRKFVLTEYAKIAWFLIYHPFV